MPLLVQRAQVPCAGQPNRRTVLRHTLCAQPCRHVTAGRPGSTAQLGHNGRISNSATIAAFHTLHDHQAHFATAAAAAAETCSSNNSSRAGRPRVLHRHVCATAGGVPPQQTSGSSHKPLEDIASGALEKSDHILSTAAAAGPGAPQNPLLHDLSTQAGTSPHTPSSTYLGSSAVEPSNTASKLAGSSTGSSAGARHVAVSTTSSAVEQFGAKAAASPTSTADALLHSSSQSPCITYRATAVVVGAGPAGVTAAMYLAKAGFKVHVLERRGHPAHAEADKKRTYLIGLGERGLRALDGIGLTLPLSVGRPMRGSVYAYKTGKRVEDPFSPATRIVGVDRQGLAAYLVNEANARYPESISFHWHVEPNDFDLQGKRIGCTTTEGDNAPLELQYDLLIGADGAGSKVRHAVQHAVQGMEVRQLTSPVAEMEYKAFHNLPWNDEICNMLPSFSKLQSQAGPVTAGTVAASDPGMVFFAFNNPQPNQPSPGSITLYLNASGSWSGTLYQPPGKFAAMQGDALTHEAAIRQFTPEGFPNEWISVMAKQMAEATPSKINPMHLVSQLAAPRLGIVLVGDAGHNVTPQMGQGCNSALEDASILAESLKRSDLDIRSGLTQFQHIRAPQVHALQHMEEENSWVRRPPRLTKDPLDKTLARIAWISFFMLLPLLRSLPGMRTAIHASLFQTIMSTTIPYDRLHTMIRAAPIVWAALVSGFLWVATNLGKAIWRLGVQALAKA